MCHNDEDEELWETDPVEYIRVKYGLYHCPLSQILFVFLPPPVP